jgi:hypothetical protein
MIQYERILLIRLKHRSWVARAQGCPFHETAKYNFRSHLRQNGSRLSTVSLSPAANDCLYRRDAVNHRPEPGAHVHNGSMFIYMDGFSGYVTPGTMSSKSSDRAPGR